MTEDRESADLFTPLAGRHRDLGAVLAEYAGWTMPIRYSSEVEEHRAVRERAAVFDLSHMAEIEVVGLAAGAALDAALVGWLSKVAPGRAKYTMMCGADGGVLDDLVVYRTGDDRFVVVANAANRHTVVAALGERTRGLDVAIVDRTEALGLVAVQGPMSLRVLEQVSPEDFSTLPYYATRESRVAGIDALVARTGYTGEDGFEIYTDADRAGEVWDALLAAGKTFDIVPAGLACRDTLRLEAGMPLYGNELDVSVTPFDAGLGRIVSFTKPDEFVGRDALAASSQDLARRTLVGLALRGRRVARSGHTVLDHGTHEVVGVVTSGAPSPTLGHPIAMAYVDRSHSTVGSTLVIDVRGRLETADVVDLPFYRRNS